MSLWIAAMVALATVQDVPIVPVETRDPASLETTLAMETEVAASIATVWQAIATPEGWRRWAAPVARNVPGAPDLIETSYSPAPGDASTIRQQILVRVPGRLLAFRTVKAPDGFPHFETYRQVTTLFELEPLGAGRTRVRLTATGYPDNEAGRALLGFFREGNRQTLEKLRAVLAAD